MDLSKKAYKWHRMLSALATIPLMMWAGSAVLHQANAWFKPDFRESARKIAPAGSEIEDIGALVRHLYHKDANIKSIKKITAFNHQYAAKNKVLPVFLVSLKSSNETILYVDLTGARIVIASNSTSRTIHKWFGYLHKWDFLNSSPAVRAMLIILFSIITLLAGWLGVYLYFLLPWLKRRRVLTPMQKEKLWHRRIGIATSLFMILFALTGLMHALSDLYPVFEQIEKPFFYQLHMYRFTEGISKQFRFWWLFVLASLFILLVFSGLLLLMRLVARCLF